MYDQSSNQSFAASSNPPRYVPSPQATFVPSAYEGNDSFYSSTEPLIARQQPGGASSGGSVYLGHRPPNFPPCKPIVHHSIPTEIPTEKRLFVRKAYFGWWLHSFSLLWNFVCVTGALVKGYSLPGFFIALLGLVVGVPASFWVYWLVYSATRKMSASLYGLFFFVFGCEIVVEGIYAIGVVSTGGGGFVLMLNAFSDKNSVLGLLCLSCTILWVITIVYQVMIFFSARREYTLVGGGQQATKEISKQAITTAYDNRETIKQVAVENKDTIVQFAKDNKDTVIDFAKEHRQEITQVVYDNRETVTKIAVENKDTVWENRDVVRSVFEENQV